MEENQVNMLLERIPSVWVFGYGSLLWKPDFECESLKVGYIEGYVRRFWQGNTTHRGTPTFPGRVATLVEKTGGKVWGVAFEVKSKQLLETMGYLNNREKVLGGYTTIVTDFVPRGNWQEPIPVLVYTATSDNEQFLGEADILSMADQIVSAKGASGTNIEYVSKMADYIREHIPEDNDEHLFALDRKIREIILRKERLRKRSERSLSIKDDTQFWNLEFLVSEYVSAS